VQRTDTEILEYFKENGISGAGATHLYLFYVSFFAINGFAPMELGSWNDRL
jgi:hypothetical protein